jgi:hypothetical protein
MPIKEYDHNAFPAKVREELDEWLDNGVSIESALILVGINRSNFSYGFSSTDEPLLWEEVERND